MATEKQMEEISYAMANDLTRFLNGTMQTFYQSYGEIATNTCFISALGVSLGSVISAMCFSVGLDRKEALNVFTEVCRASFQKHQAWKLEADKKLN